MPRSLQGDSRGEPDVTVVVAVYNTMPYLTECLDSLVGQTIGLDRLEIVAVDDGSTDDSGARAGPVRGAVSRTRSRCSTRPTPAARRRPATGRWSVATGRYVYFIGADDYLGEEALERMVAYADEHGSDVVVGKMVGTNGRYVHQALYKTSDPDVDLYDSALPFTLANTKLFRRELVEKHGLRFPEDLPVGSDQPFTLEACVRAKQDLGARRLHYYYAVKRGDASNITYRADHLARLRCDRARSWIAAALVEAGPKRDAVLQAALHLGARQARPARLPRPGPRAPGGSSARASRELADAYFTDGVRDAHGRPAPGAHLRWPQAGAIDELAEAISSESRARAPPFVLEGGRAFARYAGFRDPRLGLADRVLRAARGVRSRPARRGHRAAGLGLGAARRGACATGRCPSGCRCSATSGAAWSGCATKAMPKSADKPAPVG